MSFFIGRNVSVFAVTGDTVNCTTNAWTDSTFSFDLKYLGVLDRAKINFLTRTEEISPLDTLMENEVVIKDAFTVECEEIIPVGGRSNLLYLLMLYDFFKLIFQANCTGDSSVTALTALTVYGVRGDLGYDINRGKNIASLQLKTAGIPIAATFT